MDLHCLCAGGAHTSSITQGGEQGVPLFPFIIYSIFFELAWQLSVKMKYRNRDQIR